MKESKGITVMGICNPSTHVCLEKIYIAARQCYGVETPEEIYNEIAEGKITDDQMAGYIGRILESGHTSILEHVTIELAVTGVSRTLTHQLVRHRIASYSQQSGRHIDGNNFQYVVPPSVVNCKEPSYLMDEDNEVETTEAEKLYKQVMAVCSLAYDNLVKLGVPKEDARMLLPHAYTTNIVISFNLVSWLHFFDFRCCKRAQWEIRRLADACLEELRKILPSVFNDAGARCEADHLCPETHGCGKYPNRKKFLAEVRRQHRIVREALPKK